MQYNNEIFKKEKKEKKSFGPLRIRTVINSSNTANACPDFSDCATSAKNKGNRGT